LPTVILILGVSLGPGVQSAKAQYFGRNKVQYKNFQWQVLKTEHFDIYYYPEATEAVRQAARIAERAYARLSRLLNHNLTGRQPLILYASHPDFVQTNAVSEQPGEGEGGLTESIKRRMVIPLAGPLAETEHVITHELVHAFQFDITGQGNPGIAIAEPTALRLPLWFIEGMAEYLSVGPLDPNTAMWLRQAARHKLPTLRQLLDPRWFPYRYGQALWAYLAGKWGDPVVGKVLRAAGKKGDVNQALQSVLGVTADSLSKEWHQAIHQAYDPLVPLTQAPSDYGRLLIGSKKQSNELNVGPALSPDGKQLIFLSSRGLFSIEMFLADAESGRIRRKIVQTALDPHFDSLQFITSAGSWDWEGRRFVFGAIRKGRPVLDLLDVERGEIVREIPFPQLGEIFTPTWSPDGRYIAFSAIVGGFSDLFIYDLQADTLQRMTTDPYADLQPAWSPQGRSIAFVTDRFSTDLSNLESGHYRLAVMDPTSGEIRSLSDFDDAKNINPQWSSDGQSLYFLSDRDGITNIYRLDLATGERFQLTNLYGGVSGITALSPALSGASRAQHLVFTVYEEGDYNLYSVVSPEVLAGKSLRPSLAEISPAVLPPPQRASEELIALKKKPSLGLPTDDAGFKTVAYHPRLSLDYVGQPYLAVGADRFGTFVGGGVSLFWSDMLGDHHLATALQASGRFQDLAALVAYANLKRRWNWGAAVQRVPYVTGSVASAYGFIGGEPVLVEQDYFFTQANHEVAGLLAYPLNKAQRVEFAAGYTYVTFSQQVETIISSLITGQVLADTTVNLPSPGSLSLIQPSAALVYDNAFFGVTSPILGQRYRFEFSPTVGSLFFSSLLADYRRYVLVRRPFTLAGRILHYGRYGPDAEDDQPFPPRRAVLGNRRTIQPLFIGYPSLVRGYDYNSFSADECGSDTSGGCPLLNRLFGSKMLVANLELRFPLLLGLGGGYYGFLPIEAALFYDAGVAWQRNHKPTFLGGHSKPVRSAGVTLRVNLLGYAIVQIDYVHPFDRPKKNWLWQFSFTPGF